ncbi:MAG TPA: hypothetical protein VE994_13245 [Terriglobales bacterium]|nr:hypothetical protein [Terriglobales bacterium]
MTKAAAMILALAVLAGCSGSNQSKSSEQAQSAPAKPAAPATETMTGRAAFQSLYIAARGWAPDARPFRLESISTTDATGKDGKSAIWRAVFASAMRHSIKPYQWSGSSSPDAPSRGISPGTEDTYNPSNASTQVFDIGFLKVDSDKAFEVAQKHGGEKILKSKPEHPVTYLLDWNPRGNELIWHVYYGSSRSDASLAVDVDASDGAFLRTEK